MASLRSEAKALATAALHPEALVIGADQVLGLDGRGFDKVHSAAAARQRLALLSGRTHHLHSGLALALGPAAGRPARLLASRVVDTAMPMRRLTDAELDAYVATGEWQGSVGCYQFENRGVHLFQGIECGEHSAIVGLPLTVLLSELRALGVDTLVNPTGPWELVEP